MKVIRWIRAHPVQSVIAALPFGFLVVGGWNLLRLAIQPDKVGVVPGRELGPEAEPEPVDVIREPVPPLDYARGEVLN